jgi:hypothetical protein
MKNNVEKKTTIVQVSCAFFIPILPLCRPKRDEQLVSPLVQKRTLSRDQSLTAAQQDYFLVKSQTRMPGAFF